MLKFKEVVLSKVDRDYKDIFVRSISTGNIIGGIKLECNTSGQDFYSVSGSTFTYPTLSNLIDTLYDTYKFYDCKTNQEITVDSFNTDTISIDEIDYTKGVIVIDKATGRLVNTYLYLSCDYYEGDSKVLKGSVIQDITLYLRGTNKVYQLV